jgi:hypothetical protein
VEEQFLAAIVADEPESLVTNDANDGAAGHVLLLALSISLAVSLATADSRLMSAIAAPARRLLR